jgi:hypothetical protein
MKNGPTVELGHPVFRHPEVFLLNSVYTGDADFNTEFRRGFVRHRCAAAVPRMPAVRLRGGPCYSVLAGDFRCARVDHYRSVSSTTGSPIPAVVSPGKRLVDRSGELRPAECSASVGKQCGRVAFFPGAIRPTFGLREISSSQNRKARMMLVL